MQILILVPYIKNTSTIAVFLEKYFNISIDITHSELTNNKYLKIWIKTKNGENSIIIGTRKSIFLPFLRLGLIIILEEHNLNYKTMNRCRYNVRDIGILRASKENIPIILDSDTPSLKTLHNVLSKKYFSIKLYQYNYITKLSNVIVDLKKDKTKFGLSLTLINEINNNFKKKQVLLIFNKFNLIFFVLTCNQCGWIFQCISCKDYFEINHYNNMLFCKFCLIKIKKPIFCFNCGCLSLDISNISVEQIKNKIQNIFPETPLFFLLNKKKFDKNMFKKKNFEFFISYPCIIISTEDIVHNYYFPHVRLIGLICIDNYLLSFKFRGMEYFAQFYINLDKLIKNKKDFFKILLQTSFPCDLNLKELCANGYFSFSNKVLLMRKKFLLPPYSFQNIIYSESIYSEKNIIFLNLIRNILNKISNKYNFFLWFVGPHPSFTIKNKKKYFHKLLIQSSSRVFLNYSLNECINVVNIFSISKQVKWFVDVEPN